MKRYLLFAGHDYYPNGGAEDFVCDFNSIEELNIHLKEMADKYEFTLFGGYRTFENTGWANYLDSETNKTYSIYREGIVNMNWQESKRY